MKHRHAIQAVLMSFLALGAIAQAHEGAPAASSTVTAKELQLRQDMNRLWEDHVAWTRLFLVSTLGNLPDQKATTDRLLQNQVDIGNAVKPFYGDAAGDKLTALLKEHILVAADVVGAAAKGDQPKLQQANAKWNANADQIAAFLAKANPYWPEAEMKAHMRKHLELTTNEAVARIRQDWKADQANYDKVHDQILGMSKMLSDGIVQQFPERFAAKNQASLTRP